MFLQVSQSFFRWTMETFHAGSETGRVIKTGSVLICEHRLPHVELRALFCIEQACSQEAPTLQCAGTQFIVSRYYVTLQQCICLVLEPVSKNTAFLFLSCAFVHFLVNWE